MRPYLHKQLTEVLDAKSDIPTHEKAVKEAQMALDAAIQEFGRVRGLAAKEYAEDLAEPKTVSYNGTLYTFQVKCGELIWYTSKYIDSKT